jgi:uncharacterized MAPEG superfamily protein
MHISYWMVLAAACLPILSAGLAKSQASYDNADPRRYLGQLHGWRARANAAQNNHFEAFPAFAAGVIIAQMKGTPQHTIDLLAALFVVIRVAYTAAYVGGVATVRSVVFTAGFACVVALFVVS